MNTKFKKSIGILLIGLIILPPDITRGESQKIVNPLQEVARLECRFEKYSDLDSNCKETLKMLKPNDYKKYAESNGGYNDYTRRFTVLWGASYKYGWDIGNGGHLGVDIATAEGTPVYATADGEVIIAENKLDYGNLVSIKHTINGKTIISNYAHLSKIDTKAGKKVKAGDKIGEVGSTGNSTGNHLHFQIDIATNSSPAYYGYDTCPYTYNDIIENGKCYTELQQITIDPLEFLNTGGDDLNNITIKQVKVNTTKTTTSNSNNAISSDNIKGVFNYTIYTDSSNQDIKYVQTIFKDIGYYNGKVDGNYNSIINDIIKYQLAKNIISSKDETGAGYFGPKTRAQAKIDFDEFLVSINSSTKNTNTNNSNKTTTTTSQTETIVSNPQKTEKISRDGMLTREQIEAREIKEFQDKYNIKIELKDVGNNVSVGGTKKIGVSITDKKGNGFKGNTPYPITFIVDNSLVGVFPNKFFNFTDGKRTVTITGKKTGNTKLYIQMGTKTINSLDLMVYKDGKDVAPKSAVALAKTSIVLGDTNQGAIMLKDEKGTKLLNLKYGGSYEIKTEGNAKICVKTGDIKNIQKIMTQECKDSDYVKTKTITYDKTIGGLIVFNYKVFDKNATLKLYSYNEKKDFVTLSLKSNAPKGLTQNYAYYDDIMKLLGNNIATTNLKQGYFLEKRDLTEKEAIDWITGTLYTVKNNTADKNMLAVIDSNIQIISKEIPSSTKAVTRKYFLDKTYKYLVFNKSTQVTITYRDLTSDDNTKANTLLDKDNTWKDQFGENYYRPDTTITRGEGAFLLARAYDKTRNLTLTINQ
ncbi:MAG: M23 family metallopeptidase [Candidatus Gracilibacteria bacterium]|nr:M23 family metallopeptidase [Candidatus Gracilibacteria bacterium]